MPLPPRRLVKDTVKYGKDKKEILILDDDSVVFPEGENLFTAEQEVEEEITLNDEAIQLREKRVKESKDKDITLKRAKKLIKDYQNKRTSGGPR